MGNVVGMEKSFPTLGFLIPTPLYLLGNGMGNRSAIFNRMGNGIGLFTSTHPIAIPNNIHRKNLLNHETTTCYFHLFLPYQSNVVRTQKTNLFK